MYIAPQVQMLESDWLRARQHFTLSPASSKFTTPHFHFKMANIMMKIQQDKMALIFLIMDIFGSLNMEIEVAFSSESTIVFDFSFGCIDKKLLTS